MHGIVLHGLKTFVTDVYDEDAWDAILEDTGIAPQIYVPVTDYDDEDVFAIVGAAAELTGEEPADLLYEFGRYVVPTLVQTYGVHVEQDWTGLDLIANVETYIHEALRAKQLSEFTPPGLQTKRVDEDRVLVRYTSDRELCDLAKGLLQGVGDYYGENLAVSEHRCMHDGADSCDLEVVRNPQPLDVEETATTDGEASAWDD
jgi:predicted hydrocarbon binding protein